MEYCELRKDYVSDVECLCCKHCLPPSERTETMCKLNMKETMTQEEKFEYKITRVWDIDGQLVVAKSIEDAIALYKSFYGVKIRNLHAVGGSDYEAIIKKEE